MEDGAVSVAARTSRFDGKPDPSALDLTRGYHAGLTDALRRLREGRSGPPTDADRPPPSLFPSTPASRAAMRLKRQREHDAIYG